MPDRVAPGQPLRIRAQDWNALLDLRAQTGRERGGSPVQRPDNGLAPVRNDTGADLGAWRVLKLTGLLVSPADNEAEFLYRWAFAGGTPDSDTGPKFAITQEPIAAGAIGQARLMGLTPAWLVRPSGQASTSAGPRDGEDALYAGEAGGNIVWEDEYEGEEEHLALVAVGAGAAPKQLVWPCRVATTGNLSSLSGLQTIDYVVLADGDHVLVWQQTTASQNGVYRAAAGAWTKLLSFNADSLDVLIPVRGKLLTSDMDDQWSYRQLIWMVVDTNKALACGATFK